MNRTRQISLWKRQIPRPVDLVHQPAVGLAGGGELVVVLFQHPAQVQGGLAFCFEFGLLDSGAGRGAEAAAVGTRSLSSGLSEAEFVWICGPAVLCDGATLRRCRRWSAKGKAR